jgi:CheY-like chemotaxis protein
MLIQARGTMTRILVVEDQPSDLQIAAQTARAAGIEEVEARTTAQAAISYLEKGIRGEHPLPDGIVLDLDLGYESGYELLRYWHSTPELNKIPLVVWTILGEEQREICNLFKVTNYISKWEGAATFREALKGFQVP